jgi:ABC-type cobalamin/Fe3+-siderophores transport system ATPase subunit
MKITKLTEIQNEQKSVKAVIFGPFGIGKTSLLKTLDEPTLCLDFEAGLLSVQDWNGDVISVQTWEDARNLACLICGPNPAIK